MIAFRHQIRKMLEQPFFGYSLAIFFTTFLTKVQTVFICLSNSQTDILSEEHWKMTKQSLQNVKGHKESVN